MFLSCETVTSILSETGSPDPVSAEKPSHTDPSSTVPNEDVLGTLSPPKAFSDPVPGQTSTGQSPDPPKETLSFVASLRLAASEHEREQERLQREKEEMEKERLKREEDILRKKKEEEDEKERQRQSEKVKEKVDVDISKKKPDQSRSYDCPPLREAELDDIAFDEKLQSENQTWTKPDDKLTNQTISKVKPSDPVPTTRPVTKPLSSAAKPKSSGAVPVWMRPEEEEEVEYEEGHEDLGSVWLAELYMEGAAG